MTFNSDEKSCSYKAVARWLIFECESKSQDSSSRAQETSLFGADFRGNLALDITGTLNIAYETLAENKKRAIAAATFAEHVVRRAPEGQKRKMRIKESYLLIG